MNKSSLWIVVVVAVAWIAFLLGYAVSSHTGAGGVPATESAGTAGDGAASAGGYGK